MQTVSAAPSLKHPPFALSLAISVAWVTAMAYLQLVLYPNTAVPIGGVVALLVCLWNREKILLWSMSAALVGIAVFKIFWVLPFQPGPINPEDMSFAFLLIQTSTILIAAGVIHAVIVLGERLRAQNASLEQVNAELEAANEELVSRKEEIGHQNEEFQAQTQELERQSEELRLQSEDLQALNETITQRENMLQRLLELAQPLGNEKELLLRICQMTPELLGPDVCASAVVEKQGERLFVHAHHGFGESGPLHTSLSAKNSLTALIMEKEQIGSLDDLALRPDLHTLQRREEPALRSALVSPMRLSGEIRGSLTAYSDKPHHWTQEQVCLMEWLSAQCARVWEIIRLREQLQSWNQDLEKRVAARTADVQQRAIQLQTLASELIQVEERERRRLAQFLHDDLQQILVAAKMHAEMLRERLKDQEAAPAVDRFADLVQQSIEMSRSLTAELSPPVLYEGSFAAALNWMAREAQEKHGLKVEIHATPDIELARQETRTLLFRSARELLFNVAKYAKVDRAQIHIQRQDGHIRLEVRDEGIGFDPANRASVDGSPASGGFGLFSIRERLAKIGGTLDVVSAPGNGTRVTLLVPDLAPDKSLAPSVEHAAMLLTNTPRPMDRSAPAAIRVMLVDDHKIVREGLASVLTACEGVEIIGQAGDGQSAIENARQLRPDIIIMDISMPGMNGIEATRRIIAEQPAMKIIGLSMHEGEDMAEAMKHAGAVSYLRKGAPMEKLVSAIRTAAQAG